MVFDLEFFVGAVGDASAQTEGPSFLSRIRPFDGHFHKKKLEMAGGKAYNNHKKCVDEFHSC